ncbi:hypothetical protein [Ramlibacter sp. 2FC]|uniref:hypothetical protein n=1 Tax=Ramlibacter sp. 2FC TaxID=2502188 RepID=UPI0010F8259C|nr:hypothetical protein [Ramlibacter sp. 2FC]
MKSFFSPRSTRRTAAVMLLVWLLALATGMANACLLPSPSTSDRHAAAGLSAPVAPGQAEGAPATEQTCEHDAAAAHAKAACQSFCAAESLGLVNPQGAKTATAADLPLHLVRGEGLPVAPATRFTPRPSPGVPPGGQPPVAIRFLRLTI